MSIVRTTIAAALALTAAGAAHAESPAPNQARTIALGTVAGVAYYTVEPAGFRVVATLAEGSGTPLRVTGVLAQDQSLVLSVPRAEGVAPIEIEFRREADTLFVREPAPAIN